MSVGKRPETLSMLVGPTARDRDRDDGFACLTSCSNPMYSRLGRLLINRSDVSIERQVNRERNVEGKGGGGATAAVKKRKNWRTEGTRPGGHVSESFSRGSARPVWRVRGFPSLRAVNNGDGDDNEAICRRTLAPHISASTSVDGEI